MAANALNLDDFNVFHRSDATTRQLEDAGFIVSEESKAVPGSNVVQGKHYDQIAYYRELVGMKPTVMASVFDFYQYVYIDEEPCMKTSATRALLMAETFGESQR